MTGSGWRRVSAWWCLAGVGTLALAAGIAGCGESSEHASASNTATKVQHRRHRHAAGKRSSLPAVTGFGATMAAWNATHTADRRYAPDAVYNPDASLTPTGDEYTALLHSDGHVLGYEYHFPNQAISAARVRVIRSQFPSDAHVVWFATKGTCAQMYVQSPTLGRALASHSIGDPVGGVMVEFSSGRKDLSYTADAVNDALMILITPSDPSQAPEC